MTEATHYAEFQEPFADGDHVFRLDVEGIREFERKFEKSCYGTFRSMAAGDYRIDDIVEVIRISLVGGGMTPHDALALVRRYVEQHPPADNMPLALRILDRAYFGIKAEPKAEAA